MTTESEILQTVAKMPEALKQELLHYAKSLLETRSKLDVLDDRGGNSKKRGGLGIWKGKIWISDDFDEPLEDFEEYAFKTQS